MFPALLLAWFGFIVEYGETAEIAPKWREMSVWWKYTSGPEDGITYAQYSYYYYGSENVRVNFGPFNYTDGGQGGYTTPIGGWANFTNKCTTRYVPDYGFFGNRQGCENKVWDQTFDYCQQFEDNQIPDNYTYVGRKTINGKLCNGWHFIAINYADPQGNTMWTVVPEVDANQPPVMMEIIHNGRAIWYYDFATPAAKGLYELELNQYCSSVNTDACVN